MLKYKKFEGLVAAPFTPFDKQANLNADLIPEYYDFLARNGVTGAFINGSTGEGMSLTGKEKEVQALKWAGCFKSDGRVRIINLIGGTSYKECIENAIFSKEAGISAIAVIAPYYFKPSDDSHLAEFVTLIGEAVPEIPLYFYNIPVLTGVNIQMYGFLKKISSSLPNFAGIKYSHDDMMDFMSCLNYQNGAYDMLWGKDECMLAALALGCRGVVGSTYNYAAPLYHALIKAFNEGNMAQARKLQQKSIDMILLLDKYGGLATGKAFMRFSGLECGKFRSPVRNMEEDMYDSFVSDVKSLEIDRLLSVR